MPKNPSCWEKFNLNIFFNKDSVRPELVEGLLMSSWWFDKLTTNGYVNCKSNLGNTG
jgi:hypothetical protein